MRRKIWLAAVLAAVAGLAPAVAAGASTGSGPTAIVAMGDSFISGEGGRWLGNGSESWGTRSGTDRAAFDCNGWGCRYDPALVYGSSEANRCHRSDVAPVLSALVPVAEKVNLACSGARLENVWPAARGGREHFGELPQVDRLAAVARRRDVRMVVLTAGANDVGFGQLVAGCALDWARSSELAPDLCREAAQADVEAALAAMERGLRRALRAIRAAMAAAGQRSADYRLVAMGYASPFPAGRWIRYPEEGWSRLNQGGCPVWDADANWAAGEGIGSIVAAMRAAAAATGAEFLDLRHALDGHQLCDRRASRVGAGGPSPGSAEWVRRLAFVQGSSRESLHPNAYGQRAIGACLGFLYASPRGDYACRVTPGRGYRDGIGIEPLSTFTSP
jgi:lysophospholipase L1-like esterase